MRYGRIIDEVDGGRSGERSPPEMQEGLGGAGTPRRIRQTAKWNLMLMPMSLSILVRPHQGKLGHRRAQQVFQKPFVLRARCVLRRSTKAKGGRVQWSVQR